MGRLRAEWEPSEEERPHSEASHPARNLPSPKRKLLTAKVGRHPAWEGCHRAATDASDREGSQAEGPGKEGAQREHSHPGLCAQRGSPPGPRGRGRAWPLEEAEVGVLARDAGTFAAAPCAARA